MNRQSHKYLTLAITLMLACSIPASAKINGDELKNRLVKDNIFPSDHPMQASVDGSGATLMTWRKESWTDDDCKINAILAAKTVFSMDPSLARVDVLYQNMRKPQAHEQVSVTVGDVTAFGTGQISQTQLLSALQLKSNSTSIARGAANEIDPGRPDDHRSEFIQGMYKKYADITANASGEASTSPTSGAASSSIESGSKSLPSPTKAPTPVRTTRAPSGTLTYSNYGITFSYPSDWNPVKTLKGNAAVRFLAKYSSNQRTVVEMRVYSKAQYSAESAVQLPPTQIFTDAWGDAWFEAAPDEMKMLYAIHHGQDKKSETKRDYAVQSFTRVSCAPEVMVGANGAVKAKQKAYYAGAPFCPTVYERTIAFATNAYVIQMNLVTPMDDARTTNAVFERLLGSISGQSAAPAKPAGKKK